MIPEYSLDLTSVAQAVGIEPGALKAGILVVLAGIVVAVMCLWDEKNKKTNGDRRNDRIPP